MRAFGTSDERILEGEEGMESRQRRGGGGRAKRRIRAFGIACRQADAAAMVAAAEEEEEEEEDGRKSSERMN